MRLIATALLILGLATLAVAADRDTMPDNPNAVELPADWSSQLKGGDMVVDQQRLITVYDNVGDFTAVLAPDYYFDDFSWCDWETVSGPSYTFGPVNGYSYTAAAPGDLFSVPGAISTNSPLDSITITFDGLPVFAVGGDFFVTDFDGNPIAGNCIVTMDDGTTVTLNYPTVFAGFVSDIAIVSMTLTTDEAVDCWVAFDNFYVGQVGTVAAEQTSLSSVKALFD